MSVCRECTEVFTDDQALLDHSKQRHATISFSLGGTKYNMNPDENDFFECPCPFHPDPTYYDGIREFAAHIQKVKKWQSSPPPEAVTCISEQLIETPTLRSYSLAINVRFGILICIPCLSAVKVSALPTHLKDTHAIERFTLDRQLMPIIDYFGISSEFPTFDEAVVLEVQGLDVVEGEQCTLCNAAYAKTSAADYHFRTAHRGEPKPKDGYVKVHIQHFKSGLGNSYFPVQRVRRPVSADAQLREMLRALIPDPTISSAMTKDARNISPWLRATRWHELLEGKDLAQLRKLVEHPNVLEFPTLQKAVIHTLLEASELLDQTADLVLMKLNTEMPAKGQSFPRISNTPFHKLQEHDEKLKTYCLPIVDLLAMLLRGCHVPLPQIVQDAVAALRSSLSKDSAEASSPFILQVLSAIWKRVWSPTKENRITDPTILYLALSTLQESGQFQEPKLVTSPIARVKYCMRLIFLQCMHEENSEVHGLNLGVEHNQPWFTEKVESTFNDLCSLQHLASSIAYATAGLPRVWWLDRKTHLSMLYGGDPLHFHQVQSMIRALEESLKKMWEQDLLLGLDLFVEYDVLKDNLASKHPGYSFITDPRNTCFSDPERLIYAVMTNEELKTRFVANVRGRHISWNVHALRLWLVSYATFSLHQLVLIHLTAGASSRLSEITAMLLCNTVQYPTRNLVAFGAHVALLVTYLKTSSMTGLDKLIPHSLSAFSTDLLIQDLAIARPFARFIATICFPGRGDVLDLYNTHIFVNLNKLFTTADITEALQSISSRHLAFKLTVSSWRHIGIAWRRVLSPRLPEVVENDENDTVAALQSGHNRSTENREYGISSDNLAGAAEDVLPLYLDASTDWQVVCQVVPGGLGLSYRSSMMSSFSKLMEEGKIQPVFRSEVEAVQNVVERKLSEFGEKIDAQFKAIFMRLDSFSAPSYTPPSTLSDSTSSTRLTLSAPSYTPPLTSPTQLTDLHGFELGPKESLGARALRALQKLVGSGATWTCPEQRDCVIATLKLQQDVFSILPTGSGKTMIIAIPAMLEQNKITVVLLPLISVLLEYSSRFKKLGIPFETYRHGSALAGTTNLVFASADAGPSASFRQAVAELNEKVPVVRYVIDESHIPFLSHDYRPALTNMIDMRCSFPVQVVLLSATVTLAMEPEMISFFGLGENTVIFRTKTNRPELCYVWHHKIEQAQVAGLIVQHVKHHLKNPEDRALIFVPTTYIGEFLSKQTKYLFYHGKMDDKQDRTRIHDAWLAGGDNVAFIATSAFGTGNDYPNVRLVIHAGAPSEMLPYIQEVSRGGRDKSPAACMLMPFDRPLLRPKQPDLVGMKYIQDALAAPPQCIRYIITSFVDVEGTRCSDSPENQLCSVCAKARNRSKRPALTSFEPATHASKKSRQDRNITESDYIPNLKRQLSKFTDGCAFCALHQVYNVVHEINNCSTMDKLFGTGNYFDWRKLIKYTFKGMCYMCHIPNGHKDSIHESYRGNSGTCSYKDIVGPIIFYILTDPELCALASAHFGISLTGPAQAIPWLTSMPIAGHRSNILALFLWYADTF